MKYFFTLIFTLSILSVFAQNRLINTYEEQDKIETLDWLQGKMIGIKYSKYYEGGSLSKKFWRNHSYEMLYDVIDCQVKILVVDTYVEDRTSSRNDRKSNISFSFKFSDLKSIELKEDSFGDKYFLIKTYNSQKSIQKISTGWASQEIDMDSFKIKYTELGDLSDQPERFIIAFTDAIKMCGGSTKEKY